MTINFRNFPKTATEWNQIRIQTNNNEHLKKEHKQKCRKMSNILFLSKQGCECALGSQIIVIVTPLVWCLIYTKHLKPNEHTFNATLDRTLEEHTSATHTVSLHQTGHGCESALWLAVSSENPSISEQQPYWRKTGRRVILKTFRCMMSLRWVCTFSECLECLGNDVIWPKRACTIWCPLYRL